jgi:hypothetical protein
MEQHFARNVLLERTAYMVATLQKEAECVNQVATQIMALEKKKHARCADLELTTH